MLIFVWLHKTTERPADGTQELYSRQHKSALQKLREPYGRQEAHKAHRQIRIKKGY